MYEVNLQRPLETQFAKLLNKTRVSITGDLNVQIKPMTILHNSVHCITSKLKMTAICQIWHQYYALQVHNGTTSAPWVPMDCCKIMQLWNGNNTHSAKTVIRNLNSNFFLGKWYVVWHPLANAEHPGSSSISTVSLLCGC